MLFCIIQTIKDFFRWLYWYPIRYSTYFIPKFLFLKIVAFVSSLICHVAKTRAQELGQLYERIKGASPLIACDTVVRNTFIHKYMDYAEVLYFPRITPKNIDIFTSVSGLKYLDEALEKGNGVIVTFFHYGAQKLIMPALGHRGYTVNQFAAPPTILKDLPNTSRLYKHCLELELACEENFPATFHYTGNSLRPLYRCLANNEILLFAVDGAYGDSRKDIFYLGDIPLTMSRAIFNLARKNNAPIIPAFIVRNTKFKQELYLHPPIPLQLYEEKDDECPAISYLGDLLTEYTDTFPHHYLNQLWFLKRLPKSN